MCIIFPKAVFNYSVNMRKNEDKASNFRNIQAHLCIEGMVLSVSCLNIDTNILHKP